MQSQLVELITQWEIFAAKSQTPSVEEFCRNYLLNKEKEKKPAFPSKDADILLIKLISRISSSFNLYTKCALQNTNLENYEGFPFLNSLKFLGETKKTDVITYNLTELSTGIDILNRLLKQGLIEERQDPEDKRSKVFINCTGKF